jgi:hypothetical protein
MLLDADAEGADGDSLGDREHERRARGDLAQSVAAGGHDADAVDVRSSRVDLEAQALFPEVPEPPCHHFAKLVSSGEPAELQVEDGSAVDVSAGRKAGAAGGEEGLTEEVSSSQREASLPEGARALQVAR